MIDQNIKLILLILIIICLLILAISFQNALFIVPIILLLFLNND